MSLPDLWTRYDVQWTFFSRVYASVPADPEIREAWLRSRAPAVRPPGGPSIDEINEQVLASLAEEDAEPEQQPGYLVFQHHPTHGAIVVRAETVRAHLKDCARVLSAQYIGRVKGERAFSTKVINGLYLPLDQGRDWIPLTRSDRVIEKPDGEMDRVVRGRYGSALKRLQYVDPPSRLTFTLLALGHSIKPEELSYLFRYGGVHGYGGERSLDGGKYLAVYSRKEEKGDG